MKSIFSRVGSVESFRLVYDKDTKQPKGYGFCDYSDADTALSAIRNLNDVDFNGRRLRIDLADNALRQSQDPRMAISRPVTPGTAPSSEQPATRLPQPALPAPALPALLPPPLPMPQMPVPALPLPNRLPMPLGSMPPTISGPRLPAAAMLPGGLGALGSVTATASSAEAAAAEAAVAEVSAHTEIAQTVAAMPQAQLQLCLGSMQRLAVEAPESARAMLQEHPQLCYALLHSQLLLSLALEPSQPPGPEEVKRLKTEAASRPAPIVQPNAGVIVPPGVIGKPGGPSQRPLLPALFGAAVGGVPGFPLIGPLAGLVGLQGRGIGLPTALQNLGPLGAHLRAQLPVQVPPGASRAPSPPIVPGATTVRPPPSPAGVGLAPKAPLSVPMIIPPPVRPSMQQTQPMVVG